MKTLVLICFAIVGVVYVSCLPYPGEIQSNQFDEHESLNEEPFSSELYVEGRADRHRRATCDLLSIAVPIGSLNHSACAAHCLAKRKGYRGGRCKDGVCHCRK